MHYKHLYKSRFFYVDQLRHLIKAQPRKINNSDVKEVIIDSISQETISNIRSKHEPNHYLVWNSKGESFQKFLPIFFGDGCQRLPCDAHRKHDKPLTGEEPGNATLRLFTKEDGRGCSFSGSYSTLMYAPRCSMLGLETHHLDVLLEPATSEWETQRSGKIGLLKIGLKKGFLLKIKQEFLKKNLDGREK